MSDQTEIDYIGERGLGPWLKKRREKKGMTVNDLAQAASMGQRTISRYERDSGLGYETIRMLDALGVNMKPAPMRAGPASVNQELRDLRRAVEASGAGELAGSVADLDRRLRSLEDQVGETLAAMNRALELLVELRDDGDGQAPQRDGTDG